MFFQQSPVFTIIEDDVRATRINNDAVTSFDNSNKATLNSDVSDEPSNVSIFETFAAADDGERDRPMIKSEAQTSNKSDFNNVNVFENAQTFSADESFLFMDDFFPENSFQTNTVTESSLGFEPLTFTKPWMDTNLRLDANTPLPIITGRPEKLTEPTGNKYLY